MGTRRGQEKEEYDHVVPSFGFGPQNLFPVFTFAFKDLLFLIRVGVSLACVSV